MNQVLNIFKKDIRHHWREIAASLALTAGFAWADMREWGQQGAMAFGGAAFITGILTSIVVPLVPVSWMFLIVRVIHGESLVGDRQFWVTRPYAWQKLAAAKALFVLAFINLPLFLLDIFLLAMGGFRPTAYLGGLLWLQAMWTLILLLPTAALAAVTAGIGQMFLALLLVVVCFLSLLALGEVIPNSSFSSHNGALYFFLTIAAALAVLLMQYSRRKTTQSRLTFIGLAAVIALIVVATPYRTLIAHAYPLASGEFPMQLALMPRQAPAPDQALQMGKVAPIMLPLKLSALPNDSILELEGRILTLTNAQGGNWDSGWQQGGGGLIFPDQKTLNLSFYIPQQEFDRMSSSPVRAQLVLAFTLFHDQQQRPWVVPNGDFSLPDVGFCSGRSAYMNSLSCRVPLHGPTFLLVSSDVSATTCPLRKDQIRPEPGEIARGTLRNGGEPADSGISPVRTASISLSFWDPSKTGINPRLCPGTPVTLSNPEETGHSRIELHFDNLSLPDYREATTARNP